MTRDETSLSFISKAKEMLELSVDSHTKLPRDIISRIQNVIEELENILEEEC